MGFRLRKRIQIALGVSINISKSGVSASPGGKGATVNIGKKGIRSTVSTPGAGISHTNQLAKFQPTAQSEDAAKQTCVTGAPFSQLLKLMMLITFIAWLCGAFK
ncbi:DUF4236 domain-containing protein [Dryocola sp. BD613]|uniref:DUF4236 domain-containing protein n=1 Tax=Dryocola sp. BD613 TaxID=3133272 RepID=UPI003F50A8B4